MKERFFVIKFTTLTGLGFKRWRPVKVLREAPLRRLKLRFCNRCNNRRIAPSPLLSLFRPQERGFDAVMGEEFAEFYPTDFTLKDNQKDFLGQTLLVTAFLPDSITPSLDNIRLFVDDLREELFGDKGPTTFYQSQEFLGSYMFEHGNPNTQGDRLLILLYIRETTSEKLKSIFWNLPEWFLSYHKITHGFQVSRKIY